MGSLPSHAAHDVGRVTVIGLRSRVGHAPIMAHATDIPDQERGDPPTSGGPPRDHGPCYLGCRPSTSTPQVANMPPFPTTTLICGLSTWAAASPRICLTPSWMANMPYIPVCV